MPYQQLQFRRGTAAQWTAANPVLAEGEVGLETDTTQFKVGDGSTAWNSLSYAPLQGTLANGSVTAAKLASGVAVSNLGFTPASTGKAIAMAIVFGG